MKIYTSVEELIGNTPLLELKHLQEAENFGARILLKLESFNPAGSIKDRAALFMIDKAERQGLIRSGAVIIEPTSGNTGIGLAALGAARGYKVIIVMPDTMSIERQRMIKAYGAKVVLSEGKLGMKGAIEKAKEIAKKTANSFIPAQFDNPANAEAHFNTTGPEIFADTKGKVDIFISGVGTGGTITGAGLYLKQKKPSIKIIAVEPSTSPVLSGGKSGPHKIQGIGAGFIPKVLDKTVIDEIITVDNEAAFDIARKIGKLEGVLVGISTGAAVWAAIKEAKKVENTNKVIVIISPDGGDRYLSTELYA